MTALSILQNTARELAYSAKDRRRFLTEYCSGVADGRVLSTVLILRTCLKDTPWPMQRLVGQTIREALNLDATK